MTGILEQLNWESGGETVGLKGKASRPTDDLIPLVRRCRNHHSMAYQVPIIALLTLIFISVAFSPRPLGIGMHF